METEPKLQAVPDLDNLIMVGPLDKNDLTFSILKERSKLGTQQMEEGFPIKDFVSKAEDHDIWSEFKVLETVTFDTKVKNELCTDEEVKPFNRYSNILPYKKNPVTIPKDSYGENPYINASYVSSSLKDNKLPFIVCQSPLDGTINDFWRMVINEGVHTIVMLCKLKAGARAQSCEYFPDSNDKVFDGFKHVSLVKKTVDSSMSLTTRTFLIEVGTEKREVNHYQWEGWPDHGVPDTSQHNVLLFLIKEMRDRRSLGSQPIIVHCSAGIGRSGTLVALYNISQIIQAYNKAKKSGVNVDEEKARLSVFSVVRRLREQRYGMVQTVGQYELIYELTREILKNPKLLE